MDVRRLPVGEVAPPDADCIRLHHLADGRLRLEGSLLDGEESVSLTQSFYRTQGEAEAAGLAWADGHGVATLYVSRLGPDEVDAE